MKFHLEIPLEPDQPISVLLERLTQVAQFLERYPLIDLKDLARATGPNLPILKLPSGQVIAHIRFDHEWA